MTKRQHEQIRRAAARGAKWLDKQVPGWSRRVRRRKLDLSNGSYCILGQVEGAYDRGVYMFDLSDGAESRLGFIPSPAILGSTENYEPWDALTDAWREELKTRPR